MHAMSNTATDGMHACTRVHRQAHPDAELMQWGRTKSKKPDWEGFKGARIQSP
jgi:hypothetical protein